MLEKLAEEIEGKVTGGLMDNPMISKREAARAYMRQKQSESKARAASIILQTWCVRSHCWN